MIAVGTPKSGPSAARRSRPAARSRASSGVSVTNAPTESSRLGALEVVLDELERRHLAAAYQVALLEGGQVVEFGHAGQR